MFATFVFCFLLCSHAAAQFTTAPPTDESLQCSGTGVLVFEGDGRFSIVRDTGNAGGLTCQGDVSSMANSTLYTRIISDGVFTCSSSSSVRLCGFGDAQLITSDGSSSMLQCNGVPLSPPMINPTLCVGNGSFSVEGFGNYSIRTLNGTVVCTGSVMVISSTDYYTAGDFSCTGNGQYTISGNGELFSVSAESGNCTSTSAIADYCIVSGDYSLGGDGTYNLSTQLGNISCLGDVTPYGSYVATFGTFFCQGQDVVILNGSGLIYTVMADNFNNCTNLIDNTSSAVNANFSVRTSCIGVGANAFVGNGQFYIMINTSTPNSGLVCDGIINEVTMLNDTTFTQSFGPFRCISSGDLSINGTGVIEGDDGILCTVLPVTGEPFECSGTGQFEIIGSGFFDIVAIPEIACTGIGESSSFNMGEIFVSRGSFACNGSEFFTLNGTGEIESVTTVLGNHNCTDMPITSGSGVIDVVTCSGEGDYVIVGDGNFYINRTGPGMLQCSGEVISGVNISQRAEYSTNGEFTCSVSGIVYFTGMGRAEVINASAPYECNGVFFPGPTMEPPFSGFAGDEVDCFAYGEVVIVGNGQIEVVGQSPTLLDCQGAFSSDLDRNIVVSAGDFMCTGNGFVQITGRGEVFVNSTGFNNCTRRDTMISDDPLSCSGIGEHEIFGSANATIFASDVLVCNGDVFPLTSSNYYIGGNYRCISHGLFSINGVGNATILSKPNATAENNYSCAGPQSLTCAIFAFGGSADENVTLIGEGEFTIIGDEELYCTGSAVLCSGEINYYFTNGYFYCSSDVFAHINGTGTIENVTGANNCSGFGFGAPPIISGTPLTPQASCIGFGDQYQISGNGTFNSSRLLGTLNCNVRLQEPNSDVYIFSSNEESINCNGSGIFAFDGTGDSVIILDNGYFNCVNLTPPTSVITTSTPPTVTTSVSITVSTTVTSMSTPTTSVSTLTTRVSTPTTTVSTPTTSVTVSASLTTSVSTLITSVSTLTTSVSTPTTSVSTPTTSVSTPTTSVSTPTTSVTVSASLTTSVSTPTTSVSTLITSVSTLTTSVSTPTTSVSTFTTSVSTPTTSVSTPTTSVSTPTTSVSTPTISMSTPTTSVSTPTTSMSTLTTSVSTPTTSVSTPTTSMSTPTTTRASVVPTVTVSNTLSLLWLQHYCVLYIAIACSDTKDKA